MNGILFICILFFCAVSGFRAVSKASESAASVSASASDVVHTVKDALDIKKEFDEIRANRRNPGKNRARRYSNRDATSTVNKVGSGLGAFLKTYLYQPIAHGNFLESTIRGYNMFNLAEGKFVFGTLDGELNQSFKSIMKDGHPGTGDIISCRIPTDRMAEHYMMVMNNKIVEVVVVGGKDTHNGVIIIDSYRKSSYINSTECLHHKNRLVLRAEQIDERNVADTETDKRYQEILNRLNCTISGENSGQFNYDLMSCNCQDLVLYWAYGYMENNCVDAFFNGCSTYLKNYLPQISGYVDESGHLQKQAAADSQAIMNAGCLTGG